MCTHKGEANWGFISNFCGLFIFANNILAFLLRISCLLSFTPWDNVQATCILNLCSLNTWFNTFLCAFSKESQPSLSGRLWTLLNLRTPGYKPARQWHTTRRDKLDLLAFTPRVRQSTHIDLILHRSENGNNFLLKFSVRRWIKNSHKIITIMF